MSNEFNNNEQMQQAVNQPLAEEKKKKKKKRLTIFGIIAGVIILIIIISALSDGDSSNTTTSAGSDSNNTTASIAAAEKESNTNGQIGDYVCTIKSATICNNYLGQKSIIVTYNFTNNSNKAQSFDLALTDEAYQDGIGLETTLTDVSADELGFDVKIKPGTTKEVSKVYILRDETTPLEIEIKEFISLSDDTLNYTVEL